MNVIGQRKKQVFPAVSRSSIATRLPQLCAHDARFTAALVVALLSAPQWSSAQTALDTYVKVADPSYQYTLEGTIPGPNFTGYQIDLTSQTWRDPTEVTPNVWQHKMTIAQPDDLALNRASRTAILLIDGGSNPGSFDPLDESSLLAQAALFTNSVVVNLPTVPNEPLQFAGEAFTRTEDEIIAKTFANFLAGGDDQWPLLLPMVKSAVRAMDATQDHMANLDEPVQIENFYVIGGSKRGWTTWLTAAVDNRVSAVVPAVIDTLNIDESMRHHRGVYAAGPEPPVNCVAINNPVGCTLVGGYSLAVGDYVLEGVMDQLVPAPGQELSPLAQELLDIVDPYEYRERLVMPKYIVNSTGDEFFVPDSSQFYFDDLVETKYLRYVPNTRHSLNDEAVAGSLAFFRALAQGHPLPEFSWVVSGDGTSITVNATSGTLLSVLKWEATNLHNRDFRQATFGDLQGGEWLSSPLTDQGGGQYNASVAPPPTGATAFMVELTYDVGGYPLVFTTEVTVAQAPEPASCALLLAGIAIGLLFPRAVSGRSSPGCSCRSVYQRAH